MVQATEFLRSGPGRVAVGVFVVAIMLISWTLAVYPDPVHPLVVLVLAGLLATVAYAVTWVLRAVVRGLQDGSDDPGTPPAERLDSPFI